MNPRVLSDFFRSKFGVFCLFLVILFGGLTLYARRQKSAPEQSASAKQPELGRVRVPLEQGLESGLPQQASGPSVPASGGQASSGGIVPFRPAPPPTPVVVKAEPAAKETPKSPPKLKRLRVASMVSGYQGAANEPPSTQVAAPERFVPFGTLLKCKLVNTVDSANLETPVIAVLLEDVWQNGKRIIPANTLVHGVARSGRLRDRINAAGSWRFVWQDGRELAFPGVALDREYDHEIDGYGITDGSGGIRGRLIANDNLQELKMVAAAALSGFARGTQDRTQTALGSTITGSLSNGVREGVGDVFDLYAQRTLKDIEDNGYFVRVAAGKEFYLYVLQAIDPQKASRPGSRSPTDSPEQANAGEPNRNRG